MLQVTVCWKNTFSGVQNRKVQFHTNTVSVSVKAHYDHGRMVTDMRGRIVTANDSDLPINMANTRIPLACADGSGLSLSLEYARGTGTTSRCEGLGYPACAKGSGFELLIYLRFRLRSCLVPLDDVLDDLHFSI